MELGTKNMQDATGVVFMKSVKEITLYLKSERKYFYKGEALCYVIFANLN